MKTINEKELNYLRSSTRFEVVKDPNFEFYFGFKPLNLDHPQAYRTLLPYWNEDPKVTKLCMSYSFAEVCWVFWEMDLEVDLQCQVWVPIHTSSQKEGVLIPQPQVLFRMTKKGDCNNILDHLSTKSTNATICSKGGK